MGQERVIQERSSLSGHDPASWGFLFSSSIFCCALYCFSDLKNNNNNKT